MALNAYLILKGQKQGDIKGNVTLTGRENSILIHSYGNQISSPRDAASGLPTGKRLHTPIAVIKEVDKSSPALWNAFVNNENLVNFELQFWSAVVGPGNPPANEQQTYKVKLTNANIASIREFMPDNQDLQGAKLPVQQEITFTYQRIEWTWLQGGLVAQDDWTVSS